MKKGILSDLIIAYLLEEQNTLCTPPAGGKSQSSGNSSSANSASVSSFSFSITPSDSSRRAVSLTLSLYLYASDILPAFSKGVVFIPYLIYFLCCFIIQLYMKDKDPITRWSHSFMGQVYIALPIGLLSFLAFEPSSTFLFYNPWLLLSFFAFIWINDTGAFLVGSAIGKKRLFERISPKKSWEGFWGGIAFNLVLAYILSTQFNVLSQLEWYGLAITVSIFATLGDLCESLLKRTLQIKDSGSILPGHGGMLDRFDSVLLAAPAAVIYLFLCHQFY